MVDGSGFENRRTRKGTRGSNPFASADGYYHIFMTGTDSLTHRMCRVCSILKENSLMKLSRGKPSTICKSCSALRKRQNKDYKSKANERARRRSADPAFADKHICNYSRNNDKKKGRQNDLNRGFIKEMISKGCSYCGHNGGRMTLDRIDNSIGHLKTNVVPACIRCNYVRRDMPYEAWIIIAPSMRKARELGLFGSWDGSWPRPLNHVKITMQG